MATEPLRDVSAAERLALIREEMQQAGGRPTDFYVLINETQAFDLASGYLPPSVQAMVLAMLDFRRADENNAKKPIAQLRKRK